MTESIYLDVEPLEPNAAPGKGPIPCDLAFVGIAPSPNRPRDRINEPFGASSYRMLQRIVQTAEQRVYITNLVKTPQKPGKKVPVKVIRYYYPLLMEELKLVQPKRILALGTEPAKILCPGFDEMREDHGTLFYNPELNAEVVPTYHFSAVARDPTKRDILARDIARYFNLPRPEPSEYRLIKKIPYLPKGATVFLDLETTGVEFFKDKILQVGFTWNVEPLVYILENPTEKDYDRLATEFEKKEVTLVGHNLQFDLLMLATNTGFFWDFGVEDTMMMAHALGEEILSLKHLTTTYTDRPGCRAYGTRGDYHYLVEDVLSTRELYQQLDKKLGWPFVRELFDGLVPNLAGMSYSGVFIDRERLSEAKPHYEKEVARTLEVLTQTAGSSDINWNSPPQVAQYLLDHKVNLTETTPTGNYSVKESVLLDLAEYYPAVKTLLEYREAKKHLEFLQDYEDRTTDDHPYLNPKMKLWGAVTGRTSCEEPNLQNVPRTGPAKTIFISRWEDGLMGLLDLQQAELRVAGLLSGDKHFVDMLLEDDPHMHIASLVYQIPLEKVDATRRKRSKGITFGLLYGGSPRGLAARVGVNEREVNTVLAVMFERFPGLMKYIDRTKKRGIQRLEIFTPYGKRRDLNGIMVHEGRGGTARKAINTPIQGCASEISLMILLCIIESLRDSDLQSRALFGVHDSSLLDVVREEYPEVGEIAQKAFMELNNTPLAEYPMWERLPFTGELILGSSWAAIESTNENYDPENNIVIKCSSHGV